jgi:NADPH-dependent glutamate synthase beta subunit-like oxidoreductase
MPFTNNALVDDHYDVVVIGAGIGGITAGALLANRELSVLVVEQHYLPGGVCTSVRRDGAAMDAGAALLFGWAPNSASPHLFVMNELDEPIDMIAHDSLYRMHFSGGRSVTFWRDFERYREELDAAFPGKQEQIRGFYDDCFEIFHRMTLSPMPMSPDTMPRSEALKMLLRHPVATARMPSIMNTSLKSLFDKHLHDRELEGFFDLLLASCYCTTIEETPLMLGAAVVCSTHDVRGDDGGASYPAGSPQMLPNKLEKALEKNDGQVLYRHLVSEIEVVDGRAVGIVLDDGTQISAKTVVSDADVFQLYGSLLAAEHVPEERRQWAAGLAQTLSAVVIYLSVDAEAVPEGTRHIEAFIGDLTVLERDNYFVYIPSIDDPSICPADTHSMSILCSAGPEPWPRPDDPAYQSREYEQRKQEFAEGVLALLEQRWFPGLRSHIRTIEVGTPGTIERFTLKAHGGIGGPKQQLGQHLLKRLHARTEIPGLYAVGDSTVMGEGVVSVTASAVGAANMVLGDLGYRAYPTTSKAPSVVRHVKGAPRSPLPPADLPLDLSVAARTAVECDWCESPACTVRCPAGIDIPGFIRRIEAGNVIGAARALREMNPMSEVCGHVCPAEQLCESECHRLTYSDESVRIRSLHEWATRAAGPSGWSKVSSGLSGRRVGIVGAGPAGLTCAHFLARAGHESVVIEARDRPGGMLAGMVPEQRLPAGVLERELAGMASERITIRYGTRLGADISLAELQAEYDAVFLAAGLWSGRPLDVPGARVGQVTDAFDFLGAVYAGSSMPRGQHIVVIGGGSVACDAALASLHAGAATVTLVCPEARTDMPATHSEIDDVLRAGVTIHDGWGPLSVAGNTLQLAKCTGLQHDSGRVHPVLDPTASQHLRADVIVTAVGQQMASGLSDHLSHFVSSNGLIAADRTTQRVSGSLFAGGDLTRSAGTIAAAVGDGRRAAVAMDADFRADSD